MYIYLRVIKTENQNETLVFGVQDTFLLKSSGDMAYWYCLYAYEIKTSSFFTEKFEPVFLASCDDVSNRSFQKLIDS